ncbi:hypothetical protein, partial [Bacillus sp. WP8]|uniref:hypothetical protein n=1 Tax=Bacillus sp. WP8 TaxID=756828 RepID=UPI001C92CCD7
STSKQFTQNPLIIFFPRHYLQTFYNQSLHTSTTKLNKFHSFPSSIPIPTISYPLNNHLMNNNH